MAKTNIIKHSLIHVTVHIYIIIGYVNKLGFINGHYVQALTDLPTQGKIRHNYACYTKKTVKKSK